MPVPRAVPSSKPGHLLPADPLLLLREGTAGDARPVVDPVAVMPGRIAGGRGASPSIKASNAVGAACGGDADLLLKLCCQCFSAKG